MPKVAVDVAVVKFIPHEEPLIPTHFDVNSLKFNKQALNYIYLGR